MPKSKKTRQSKRSNGTGRGAKPVALSEVQKILLASCAQYGRGMAHQKKRS